MIRVDSEVYAQLLACRGLLERATGRHVPIGRAVAFILALSG